MTDPLDDLTTDGDPVSEAEVVEDRARSRRSVGLILGIVALCVVIAAVLGWWASADPSVSISAADGVTVQCTSGDAAVAPAVADRCDAAIDEARSDRRRTALLIGAVAFTVAMAVSTWPSHRLTGRRLGPTRL